MQSDFCRIVARPNVTGSVFLSKDLEIFTVFSSAQIILCVLLLLLESRKSRLVLKKFLSKYDEYQTVATLFEKKKKIFLNLFRTLYR